MKNKLFLLFILVSFSNPKHDKLSDNKRIYKISFQINIENTEDRPEIQRKSLRK